MKTESIAYTVAGGKFQGEFIHDDTAQSKQPLLLMCPNWAGVTIFTSAPSAKNWPLIAGLVVRSAPWAPPSIGIIEPSRSKS